MINTLLWLTYAVSAGLAFFLVLRPRWRLVPAMVTGTAVGTLLALLVLLLLPREEADPWFQVDLALNGSLCLIFAGAGAAVAYALRTSRE